MSTGTSFHAYETNFSIINLKLKRQEEREITVRIIIKNF